MRQAVLILAHGSRDSGARVEYQRVAEAMAARLPQAHVELGVLEFPGDDLLSIPEALRRCVQAGAERVVALPFFLFAAGHVREDLPTELMHAATEAPGLKIAYQPPIGVDRLLLEALESRAAEAEQTLPTGGGWRTVLLLIGAGTSDAQANAELYRAARLLWERRRYDLVEVGFVSLTEPKLLDAVARCRALGAARVLVVPYFLNTGVLSRRIAAKLEACKQEYDDLQIALGAEVGMHPAMLDLLEERATCGLAAVDQNGLDLPPCAEHSSPWACRLEKTP